MRIIFDTLYFVILTSRSFQGDSTMQANLLIDLSLRIYSEVARWGIHVY